MWRLTLSATYASTHDIVQPFGACDSLRVRTVDDHVQTVAFGNALAMTV